MPIELHERLSEFSYGYGVTREVDEALRTQGLKVVPFLPSLLHEGSLGFDVAFDVRGTALMVQFKLGQALRRFSPGPRPPLEQPFWRFAIDTAEPDGQFELLLKAEQDGADVFYVAPTFHDWEVYLRHYEKSRILERSLLLTPGGIRSVLAANGIPDGRHKIVYDTSHAYVCSDPLPVGTVNERDFGPKVRSHVDHRAAPLGDALEEIFAGFERRGEVRRLTEGRHDPDRAAYAIPSDDARGAEFRRERFERFLGEGRSRSEAIALAVGAETWSMGAQLIFVTDD